MPYAPDSTEGRFIAGDREAVGQVVRWVSQVLASPNFWGLRAQSADLAQEVLGRVIESLRKERFDATREFRTYVQGVARFTAFSAIGKRPRELSTDEEERPEDPDPQTLDGAPEDQLVARELARHVLDRANEGCRELIAAYFLEQKAYAEIAEESGQPVGTLKSRLFRCLDAARLALGGRAAIRAARGAG